MTRSELEQATKAAQLAKKDLATEKKLYPVSCWSHSHSSFPHPRAQLVSEAESLHKKLEKATLSKNVAESKLGDFEREKTMIELEIQEILVRHKSDVTERMSKFARVRADHMTLM